MIVVGELMARITRDRDLPLHYEASPLKAAVGAVGWLAGIVTTIGGVLGYAEAESLAAETGAAFLVLAGGTLIVALVRCRRHEVIVGQRMIDIRMGPFRRTLPTGCVEEAVERPASSWRRFYAPSELALTLSVESRPLVVPTNDPDELRAVLQTGDSDRSE
jgi:uncharacterized membrane protein